ncbi:MAG: glycosyltransferase family 2 protein [Bacillota bacterium]|nr:glycosyltransferase family 2 protein [Bacillota bacterium]
MKLSGVAMVKNEQDIIEVFVRHNLKYLDSLHLIDHDSFDETGLILSKLKEEGLPITIEVEKKLEHWSEKYITKLARKIFYNYNPDFIFLLDADEFIKINSRRCLEESLLTLETCIPAILYL